MLMVSNYNIRLGDENMMECYSLEEVAEIKMGEMMMNDKYLTRDGTPFITKETFNQLFRKGRIHSLPKVSRSIQEQYSFLQVPAKSILVTKLNLKDTNIYQCETELCIGRGIIAIIPNESIVVSDYLFHFFKWYQLNKEGKNIYQIVIDLPTIAIQYQVVHLLNRIQQLLANRDFLITAVEGLPRYFSNISQQANQQSRNLHQGFEQLQYLYMEILHKIFNDQFLADVHEHNFCQKLNNL